jgi:hypothetical protein
MNTISYARKDFWSNIPDDCKKAISELKRLKVHKIAGYDYEDTFADVWWLILHEVDMYAEGEYGSDGDFNVTDSAFMNKTQAKRADQWLIKYVDLFNKYKNVESFGEKEFIYTGQI